jgi:hypothetical protein
MLALLVLQFAHEDEIYIDYNYNFYLPFDPFVSNGVVKVLYAPGEEGEIPTLAADFVQ